MTVHKPGFKWEDVKEGDFVPEEDAQKWLNDPDQLGRTFLAMQKLLAEHYAQRERERAQGEAKP